MYNETISQYMEKMNLLLGTPSANFSDVSSSEIPRKPGVYVIYDRTLKSVIYAGRTKNLRRRLLSDHRRGNIDGSQFRKALGQKLFTNSEKMITQYILDNCSFRFLFVERFEKMVRLEHFITAILGPLLNVQLKQ